MDIYPLTIYHDGRCPICQAEIDMLRTRDRLQHLRFQDIHDPAFDPAELGLSLESLDTRIHARRADGEMVEGVDVFNLAYRAVGLDPIADVVLWRPIRPLTRWLYTRFARHRHTISRVIGPFITCARARQRARRVAACGDRCRVRSDQGDAP